MLSHVWATIGWLDLLGGNMLHKMLTSITIICRYINSIKVT